MDPRYCKWCSEYFGRTAVCVEYTLQERLKIENEIKKDTQNQSHQN
jgi:hypothetical protein